MAFSQGEIGGDHLGQPLVEQCDVQREARHTAAVQTPEARIFEQSRRILSGDLPSQSVANHARSCLISAVPKDPKDFHAFATQGSTIAHASFEAHDFEEALATLNNRFGLKLVAPEGLDQEVLWGLRRAAGRFQQEKYPIEKPIVARRLKQLNTSAERAALALQAMDEGLHEYHDIAALQLLKEAMQVADPSLSMDEVQNQLALFHTVSATLYFASKEAQVILSKMGGKKGQRGLSWYDAFFEALLKAAKGLGIPLTTAGDRSRNPHETPLTVLAQELERSLPKEARAPTFAACAKRVQEALKARKARANSSKTK